MSMEFARAALAERRPLTFLSLAPTTSSSYPQMPLPRTLSNEALPVRTQRRSSSSTSGFRVLKLGPVYWGEHADEHKEDFHDVPASPPSVMEQSAFLSLAPTTSASYPQMPTSSSTVQPERRRSSSGSTTGFRVLKLGPVYWGEHGDGHKDDFHDVGVSL